MTLSEKRRAIRHLIDERDPADALAAYFAFYHDDRKTSIVTYPIDAGAGQARGYVALSRTGVDLFRPFISLRLPFDDFEASVELIYSTMSPGMDVILNAPERYAPLLQAVFDIHAEDRLNLFVLRPGSFKPLINVLVTQTESPRRLPQYVIRRNIDGEDRVVATAGLNWQTPNYAEISVTADPRYRRRGWGRSVVSTMCQHLLSSGRAPLYVAAAHNDASIQLAKSLGFADTGTQKWLIQGTLRPRP